MTMKFKIKHSVILIGFLLFMSCGKNEEQMQVYSEFKDVRQLVLAEMTINKIGTINDMTWEKAKGFSQHVGAFVNTFKPGARIGVYSYNTYLQAYMDLGELKNEDVEVDQQRKFVKIILPPVRTRYIGRDMGIKEEHLRVTGLRSSITPQERAQVKEVMNEALKAEINNNSELGRRVEAEAERKAREFFTLLLRNRGYESEITFR